jgi:molybdopterin/thiamine biosynthesis adenylyltransferase
VSLDTARIDHILRGADLASCTVVVAGLGSGGFPVMQLLSMSGVRRWVLFDPDTLDAVNLVKHPARRSDLGRLKVDIAAEWLNDRNPASSVEVHAIDVVGSDQLGRSVRAASLVICGVDSSAARMFINQQCVELGTPCVTGSVFRTGFGGEVFCFIPGETGCLLCMETLAERQGLNLGELGDLTADEKELVYGQGVSTFRASGLAAEIATVSALHAQMALSILLTGTTSVVPTPTFNWLVFGNRPQHGVFASRFEARRLRLKPQVGCFVNCSASRRHSGAAGGRDA